MGPEQEIAVKRSILVPFLIAMLLSLGIGLGGHQTARANARQVVAGGSLQAALASAQPGDTLLLEAGSYSERLDVEASGQAQAPITIRGAGVGASTLTGGID